MSLAEFAKKAFLAFLAVVATVANAETHQTISLAETPYRGGKDRYINRSAFDKSIVVDGQFLELPLDPSRPAKGAFDLFYRISKNFDPARPSVIFFNGGPGGSSDDVKFEDSLADFNFIYLDQRGTSFSHLRTEAEMLDSSNFSSELIARDAEALREHLGIEQVTVYGHSYGTIPATIYASLFPSHTRAVVLEGVIFDGQPTLWSAPYRLKIMQSYFDGLSSERKAIIQAINETKAAPSDWLSRTIRSAMYEPFFSSVVDRRIDELGRKSPAEAAKELSNETMSLAFVPDSTYFGSYMLLQIGCRELSMMKAGAAWDYDMIDGKFQLAEGKNNFRSGCDQLPGMSVSEEHTYFASDYPVQVPITYFEGTADGATVAPNAMKHWRNVAKSRAQLFYIVNGGHSSVTACMGYKLPGMACAPTPAIAGVVSRAFLGELIPDEVLSQVKEPMRFARGVRFRAKIPKK